MIRKVTVKETVPDMGKVRLKFSPLIASMLNGQGSDKFTLEKEITDGATISDVFTALASSESNFRKVVFNPDAGKVSEQVHVFLNDSLLPLPDVTEVRLNDGDTLFLVSLYSGG